jgi:hypothetical protein
VYALNGGQWDGGGKEGCWGSTSYLFHGGRQNDFSFFAADVHVIGFCASVDKIRTAGELAADQTFDLFGRGRKKGDGGGRNMLLFPLPPFLPSFLPRLPTSQTSRCDYRLWLMPFPFPAAGKAAGA